MNFRTVDWVRKIRNQNHENNKNLSKAQKIKKNKNLAEAFLDQNKKNRPLKSKI